MFWCCALDYDYSRMDVMDQADVDVEAVYSCITGTFNPDSSVRSPAETKLRTWEEDASPGFLLSLVKILEGCPDEVRRRCEFLSQKSANRVQYGLIQEESLAKACGSYTAPCMPSDIRKRCTARIRPCLCSRKQIYCCCHEMRADSAISMHRLTGLSVWP